MIKRKKYPVIGCFFFVQILACFDGYGDESDLGIVYIDNIRVFDEDGEEILDNDFITDYNHNSKNFFYQEDDSEKHNQIITEIADKLNVSKEIIDESFSE